MQQVEQRARMMTDLAGVECVVGLCVAAFILWIARRRRIYAEAGAADKRKLAEHADDVADRRRHRKVVGVQDARSATAGGDAGGRSKEEKRTTMPEETKEDSRGGAGAEPQSINQTEEEPVLPDLAANDNESNVDDGDDKEASDLNITDEECRQAMDIAERLAEQIGPNMTESVMAMSAFLVLDSPELAEAERMRMEDPTADEMNAAQITDDITHESEAIERPEVGDNVQEAASEAKVDFWARCENKDQCSICDVPFSFLNRRVPLSHVNLVTEAHVLTTYYQHHCRKCCSSVCARCSAHNAFVPEFSDRLERVCDRCWPSITDTSSLKPEAGESDQTEAGSSH